jgi:TolA-binding protein
MLMAYRHTDWFKPAADNAVTQVKSAMGHAAPNAAANDAQLDQARDAYASGDVDGAVAAYRAYLKQNPADVDAYGELGNVFYSVGDLDNAAHAYYDAASRLIEQKQMDRANELIPLVGQGNLELANDLTARMAQVAGQPAVVGQANQEQSPQPAPQGGPQYY